ncbi:MAG: type II secretion system protein GspN [Labilithrix sp.]|nr:type II secretion system protein GspN [Labilithrix sp.]MCW5813568.1 type II secretion system protein GspN [Labilithrix sp.]
MENTQQPTATPQVSSGPSFPDRMKVLARRIAPKLGYPAFYLFCLLIFISWTFPYEKLKDRIVTQFNAQQSKSRNPQELQIDELDSSFVTGVKAKGVRLISPPAEAGKAPSVLTIDEARARISLLGLLVGNKSVSFKVEAFDGIIKGAFDDSGKTREIEMSFDGVDVGRVDLVAANVGFPIDGKLFGAIKLTMPEGKASKANGTIELEIRDANAGNTKELTLKTPLGPFTLPRLKIGNFMINGEAKDGVLKITKISASGGDVDVAGDGKIQLREVANDAHLDVNLKFKINDAYRNKNDKTKLLFGSPGSKEKPMLEMDPKMGKAKGADGFYVLRVGGTLGKPDVRAGTPASGPASEPK